MATLQTLLTEGRLQKIDWPYLPKKRIARTMYATSEFKETVEGLDKWLKKETQDSSPWEQFLAIMGKYFKGWRMSTAPNWDDVKSLKPYDNGIWEFRTEGLRIFGWFVKRDYFVAHSLHDKDDIADNDLTSGHGNAAAYYRDHVLGFKPGETITSGKIEDVLSNQV